MPILRRILPLAILLAALAALWASGLAGRINWATLGRYQGTLDAWIGRHRIVAPVLYAALYAVVTALSVPEAAVLTVAGGLLFGALLGGAMAVIGATAGALVLFLAARSAFATAMAARGGSRLARIRAELHRNGFSYLLAIRLIPAFPFWLVNLAAALAGMRLLPFAAATFLGIIPATFVFAWIGTGVGAVLAAGSHPRLAVVFSPQFLAPLVALGLLALLPVAWRHWKRPDG
ncbi:MAG TPA: VTT domain-containing protein [Acetobacteraceae bacterium]|nr:VTT domain-containing protein [Acetobacteraceae bacterium]